MNDQNKIDNSGGTSDVSAKEQLDTHGSGEPSADNVNVEAGHGKGTEAANAPNPGNADNSQAGASDVSAKE